MHPGQRPRQPLDSAGIRIKPGFGACLRYSLTIYLTVFAVVLVIAGPINLLKGEPFVPPDLLDNWHTLLLAIVGLVLGTALLVYAIGYASSAVITSSGIRGRSFWGLSRYCPWDEISDVGEFSTHGITYIVVKSPQAEVYVFLLGVDLDELHQRLYQTAGPDHVLTRWLEGDETPG